MPLVPHIAANRSLTPAFGRRDFPTRRYDVITDASATAMRNVGHSSPPCLFTLLTKTGIEPGPTEPVATHYG